MPNNIVVIGSGAWGTAIAKQCEVNGHNVSLYARKSEDADKINTDNENKKYLPDVNLDNITATADLSVCETADVLFIVTPSQNMREMISNIKTNAEIVICCKGIENETLETMEQIAKSVFPNNNISVFSGPTFAIEVARGMPTVATLAGTNTDKVKDILSGNNLRIYPTTDVIGVEVLGTIKNVLAIACGIVFGKELGDNARASLITRGLAEASRLTKQLGGNEQTALSPAGMGDLILTCSSIQSRNMSFGVELGRGKSVNDILKSRTTVAEGVANAKSIINLASKHNIEMPICNAVYNIIYKNADIDTEIKNLLNRDN